jgi:hypothetical protein
MKLDIITQWLTEKALYYSIKIRLSNNFDVPVYQQAESVRLTLAQKTIE